MSNIQAKVAQDKEAHPKRYCAARRCLWRTDDTYCPRHGGPPQGRPRKGQGL